jgi:DNA topoisomerase-3
VKKDHTNPFLRKRNETTQQFTEATLLRAMETAARKIDDEDLRN